MLDLARKALEDGVSGGHHRGAQLSIIRGGVPHDMCVGEARPGQVMAADVVLPWFSCTKVLTAVAVLQQCEQGSLSLDDPVAQHMPEFAVGGKDGVLVRHLLTHTGGFRGPADRIPSAAAIDPIEVAALAAATPLEDGWVPGRRAAYQPRGGFAVLARLVSQATGQPFADYVTERVIEPLGLHDTWSSLPARRHLEYGNRIGLVEDRTSAAPVSRPELSAADRATDGSTGVLGPARDLVRVAAALGAGGELEGERILDPDTVIDMRRRHRQGLRDETFGAVIDWGLGVMINSWHYQRKPAPYGYGDRASADAFGHGGARSSVMFADPDNDLAVALIVNGLTTEPVNHRRTQPVLTALYQDLGL